MLLEVKRTQFGEDATNGELYVDGVWETGQDRDWETSLVGS